MSGVITFNDRRGIPQAIEFLFAVEDGIIEITTLMGGDVRATQISRDDARRLGDWIDDVLREGGEK
jgi:hypothetical protein